MLSPSSLTFTDTNPQTVTVTGIPNAHWHIDGRYPNVAQVNVENDNTVTVTPLGNGTTILYAVNDSGMAKADITVNISSSVAPTVAPAYAPTIAPAFAPTIAPTPVYAPTLAPTPAYAPTTAPTPASAPKKKSYTLAIVGGVAIAVLIILAISLGVYYSRKPK